VCKIAVGSNPKLKLKDTGMAVRRRVRLAPFDYTVPDDEIVVNLEERLLGEAPEILTLLIYFAKEYYRRGGERDFRLNPKWCRPSKAINHGKKETGRSPLPLSRELAKRNDWLH
jgi:hypothetical protein